MKKSYAHLALRFVAACLFVGLGAGMAQAQNPTVAAASAHPIKLTSQRIVLPFGNRTFGNSKVARLANERCLLCHSRGMVDTQPPLSAKTWRAEVVKMKTTYGCPLPDDEVDELAKFMYELNSERASKSGE
jgi:hypothetical protein